MHYFRIYLLIPFILNAAPISKLKIGDEIIPALRHHSRHHPIVKQLIHDVEISHEINFNNYHLKALKKIQFTAYFAPIIEVKSQRNDEYRFAIYQKPNLEIAWTKNPLDVFWMQIQGSGMAKFEDGSMQLLAFDGKNGPYVFFKRQNGLPKGAAGFELTPRHSVAVDPKIFPYGSVLLIKLGKNDWRLVVAQDTGSAITGPRRMDLYLGIGDEAHREAGPVRQFGEAWLVQAASKVTTSPSKAMQRNVSMKMRHM